MTGTLINAGAIILGGIIGVFFRSRLPERFVKITFQAIGLFTLFLGVSMALKGSELLIIIFSMVLGGILGEWMKLDKRINAMGEQMKARLKSSSGNFAEGMVTAFLLYCMGSLTILGAIEEGLGNPPNLLLAKSLLDGVSAIALSAALGYGVLFSIIPLLIYQGGLTLLTYTLGDYFNQALINELTAVGGLMLLGLGLSILEIKKINVTNFLPALIVVVVLGYLFI
jgi:uncharacterized membrane protein YqgA involved in biofilm formation